MADINVSNLPEITSVTNDDYVIVNDSNSVTSIASWANIQASLTSLAAVGFQAGTVGAPSIFFTGDPNTGIYSPGADTLAITTAGSQVFVADSQNNIGINQPTPNGFNAGAKDIVIGNDSDGLDHGITICTNTNGSSIINFARGIAELAAAGQIVYDHTTDDLKITRGTNEIVRFNNSDQMLVGTILAVPGARLAVDGGSTSIDDGAVGLPGLNFIGDTDTGFYRVGIDKTALVTGGVQRLVIDQSGNLGVGVETPTNNIDIQAATPGITLTDTDQVGDPLASPRVIINGDAGNLRISADDGNINAGTNFTVAVDGTDAVSVIAGGHLVASNDIILNSIANGAASQMASIERGTTDGTLVVNADPGANFANSTISLNVDGDPKLIINDAGDIDVNDGGKITFSGDSDTFISRTAADTIAITSAGLQRFTVESDGSAVFGALAKVDQTNNKFLVGGVSAIQTGGFSHQIQATSNATRRGFQLALFENTSDSDQITFAKSRGTTSARTIVNDGDQVGIVQFAIDDGVDIDSLISSIKSEVDGTPSTTSTPGRVVISTTPGGGTTPVERLRVNAGGAIGLGGANFGDSGQLMASTGGNTTPAWIDLPLFDISTLTDLP